MSNICSVPRVTEQLHITSLGHRGDGVADTPAGAVYVPYTLPGETVTVEPVAGHPDRRHLAHVDRPSHERAQPVCKHFGQPSVCFRIVSRSFRSCPDTRRAFPFFAPRGTLVGLGWP